MKNAMQLKALIQNFSKSKNISSQAVMQNYMLERLLERISISQYKTNFILKGGFLISAMIGIDSRTTMDMDATIQKIVLSKDMVVKMFDDICNTFLSDNISFLLKRIEDIHEHNQYSGYRIHIEAKFEHLLVSLKVDITAGDPITPFKIAYDYKLLFEPRNIRIYAYNLETIIAEKLETIVSRGNQNTRLRDFYDIYILNNLLLRNIDFGTLRLALIATSLKEKHYP